MVFDFSFTGGARVGFCFSGEGDFLLTGDFIGSLGGVLAFGTGVFDLGRGLTDFLLFLKGDLDLILFGDIFLTGDRVSFLSGVFDLGLPAVFLPSAGDLTNLFGDLENDLLLGVLERFLGGGERE